MPFFGKGDGFEEFFSQSQVCGNGGRKSAPGTMGVFRVKTPARQFLEGQTVIKNVRRRIAFHMSTFDNDFFGTQ